MQEQVPRQLQNPGNRLKRFGLLPWQGGRMAAPLPGYRHLPNGWHPCCVAALGRCAVSLPATAQRLVKLHQPRAPNRSRSASSAFMSVSTPPRYRTYASRPVLQDRHQHFPLRACLRGRAGSRGYVVCSGREMAGSTQRSISGIRRRLWKPLVAPIRAATCRTTVRERFRRNTRLYL
jgi:hypothetical protein